MALIECPDCGHEVSDQAVACPHCGRPIRSVPEPTGGPGGNGVSAGLAGKRWSKLTLLGAIMLVLGFAASSLPWAADNVVKMGSVFFVVGTIALLAGFVGGWWTQG